MKNAEYLSQKDVRHVLEENQADVLREKTLSRHHRMLKDILRLKRAKVSKVLRDLAEQLHVSPEIVFEFQLSGELGLESQTFRSPDLARTTLSTKDLTEGEISSFYLLLEAILLEDTRSAARILQVQQPAGAFYIQGWESQLQIGFVADQAEGGSALAFLPTLLLISLKANAEPEVAVGPVKEIPTDMLGETSHWTLPLELTNNGLTTAVKRILPAANGQYIPLPDPKRKG